MHPPPRHSHTDPKEMPPQFAGLTFLYGPVLWVMAWIMRAGRRTLVPRIKAPQPLIPHMRFDNRNIRRAEAVCVRQLVRDINKYGKGKHLSAYKPRALTLFYQQFGLLRPWRRVRFGAHYCTDISRPRLLGLSKGHRITSVSAGGYKASRGPLSRIARPGGALPFGAALPFGPAPP